MTQEYILDGNTRRIDLGSNYAIRAPGLTGRVIDHDRKVSGTRGPELATPEFDAVLASQDVTELKTIELEVRPGTRTQRGQAMRSPGGEEEFELEVPDLGERAGQVVMAIDESGVVTWHFPDDDQHGIAPSVVRGAGGVKRFRLRSESPPAPPSGASANRGLFGFVGRKILKALVYPVTDVVLGPIGEHFAGKWEAKHRPYGVRGFLPSNYRHSDVPRFSANDWQAMSAGRSLLFVHGTFSTAHDAFSALPEDTLAQLARLYDNRVFAFDHPTLSVDPLANAQWFLDQVPQGVALDLDIVSHSRGGLVSRCLAELFAERLRVGRLVLVGVPNAGTQLANPEHMVQLLDRFTSVLNMLPDGPVEVVLEALLAVVKIIGRSGLLPLEGLAAMDPGSEFLARLNRPHASQAEYYAISADFDPVDEGLLKLMKYSVANVIADRVFEDKANDLVVPSGGVVAANGGSSFPVPGQRVLSFDKDAGVTHINYFSQADCSARLLDWLAG